MAYTTATKLRDESGFAGNDNLSDPDITPYLNRAHGMVQAAVGSVYLLSELSGSKFSGSDAEALLEGVETTIGSGLLLIREYGPDATDSDKDGYKKLTEGKAMLEMIRRGEMILLDTDQEEFKKITKNTSGAIWADAIEDDDNIFSINDKY